MTDKCEICETTRDVKPRDYGLTCNPCFVGIHHLLNGRRGFRARANLLPRVYTHLKKIGRPL